MWFIEAIRRGIEGWKRLLMNNKALADMLNHGPKIGFPSGGSMGIDLHEGLWNESGIGKDLYTRFHDGLVSFSKLEYAVSRGIGRVNLDGTLSSRNILPWLQEFRQANATDPRDKIYALLGLVGWKSEANDVRSSIADLDSALLLID